MKATIFSKPLEYGLIADGEKWHQGDKIKGVLSIKNHSNDNVDVSFLKVSLTVGNFKKIKIKDKKAWDSILSTTFGENIAIGASEEKIFPWEFQIPEDCQITEKEKSVYLTFFTYDNLWPTGFLQLVIDPKVAMIQFLEVFENFLRFKIGSKKSSKGMVEIKLTPPNSKELSHVESLVLRMKEVDKLIDLEYIFTTHTFEMVAGNMIAQKKTTQIDQQLSSKQLYIYKDSLNHDFIKTSISEVIEKGTKRFNL